MFWKFQLFFQPAKLHLLKKIMGYDRKLPSSHKTDLDLPHEQIKDTDEITYSGNAANKDFHCRTLQCASGENVSSGQNCIFPPVNVGASLSESETMNQINLFETSFHLFCFSFFTTSCCNLQTKAFYYNKRED